MTKLSVWFFASILGLCSFSAAKIAQAQRAATVAPRVSATHARPGSTRALAARSTARVSGSAATAKQSHISSNGFAGVGASFGALNPGGVFTPGAGFNVFGNPNADWAIEAAIDPATQWRLFEASRFHHNRGFAGAGFYLLDDGAYGYQAPPDAPPDNQQQPSDAENQEMPPAEQQEQQNVAEESAPLPDVGQFVLVLRNGSQIQAVAFTRANDRLVYVTTDGLRRTLALSDLDTDSTMRINDERGTPLQLPL